MLRAGQLYATAGYANFVAAMFIEDSLVGVGA
jgi:hypothetical protein